MTFEHDEDADAIYIRLRETPYAFGHSLDDDRHIDFGPDEKPIGIEFLGVSHGVNLEDVPEREAIAQLLQQHHVKVFA